MIRQNLCGEARKRDSMTWSIGSLDFIGFRLAVCVMLLLNSQCIQERRREIIHLE